MDGLVPAVLITAALLWRGRGSNTTPNVPGGSANDLSFVIKKVTPTFQGITPVLVVLVSIQNPTDASFTIRSISGNILINGEIYGQFSTFGNNIVPAYNTLDYPLELRLSVGHVWDDLQDMIQGNSGYQVVVGVKGKVNIDGVTYPLDLTHTII